MDCLKCESLKGVKGSLQERGNTNMLLEYYFNPVLRVFTYVSRNNLQTRLYYLWLVSYINCATDAISTKKGFCLVSTPESLNGDSYFINKFFVIAYAHTKFLSYWSMAPPISLITSTIMVALDLQTVEMTKITNLISQIHEDIRLEKSRGIERDKKLAELKIFCQGLIADFQNLQLKISQDEILNDEFQEFTKNKINQFEYLIGRNEYLEYSESLFSLDGDANCNF
jgi:hypothetical protein